MSIPTTAPALLAPAPGDTRSAVENLLAAYAQCCDERDTRGLGNLLAGAELTFGDAALVAGAAAVTALFDAAFGAGQETRHLLHNVAVTQAAPHTAASTATYMRWVLEPAPRLIGIGQYASTFVLDNGAWRFATHTVRRDWFEEA